MNNSLFKIWIFLFYFPVISGFILKNLGLGYNILNLIFLFNEIILITLGLFLMKFKVNKIALISLSLIVTAFFGFFFKSVNLIDYLIPVIVLNRFVIFVGFINEKDEKNYLLAKKIFKLFIYSQLIIGLFQIFLPSVIIDLTLPVQPAEGYKIIAPSFESWDGTIFGLFADTISYPFTLVIGYLFFLKEKKINLLMTILFGICIIQAKSIIASIFFIYLVIDQFKKINKKLIIISAIFTVLISINIILNQIDFYNIYKMFLDQRLGIILWVFPELIFNTSLDQLLFGVGIGEGLETFIYGMKNVPGLFLYDSEGLNGLNDVYYVAIMSYYGLIGLVTIFTFYYYFNKQWGGSKFSRYAILFVLISLMVNQTTQLSFFSLLFYSHINLLNSRSE